MSCIAGHISQYVLYPIFCLCYISRGLRLIILFKRAEKGLYFSDNIMTEEDADNSTFAILKRSNDDTDYDVSLRASVIHRPTSQNFFTKIYYWLLFKFESELSVFYLSLVFALFPFGLM